LNVVLVEPEIPQNTGNIVRTCAVTGAKLHLIKPLGFSIEDKYLKRAGLDYWHLVDISIYENLIEFTEKNIQGSFYYLSKKAERWYTDISFEEDAFLFFGKETEGLPTDLLKANWDRCIRIPMIPNTSARSLNLSNSVALVLYEALRQHGFKGLK